jgi:hypothetical protein
MTSQGFDGLGGPDGAGGEASQGADATAAEEVARYAAEVRAELADLPAEESAELLEDLEDHLREVAAEDAGVLRERLGEPAAYAAELRESAGLPPRSKGAGPRGRLGGTARLRPERSLVELVDAAERRVRATRFGTETLAFLPTLRPAWWVLRAWIAVRFVEVLTAEGGNNRPLHIVGYLGNSQLFGFVLLVAAIVASVWLGKQGPLLGRRRVMLLGGQTLLVLFALLTWAKADDGGYYDGNPVSFAASAPAGPVVNGRPLTNLSVYDKDGHLLTGVFVYDQDGNPVNALEQHNYGTASSSATWLDPNRIFVENMYPRETVVRVQGDSGGDWQTVPMDGPPVQRAVPKPVTHVPGGPDDCQGITDIQTGPVQNLMCEGLPAAAAPSGAASPTATATPTSGPATPTTTPQPPTTPAPSASTASAPPSTPAPATSSP